MRGMLRRALIRLFNSKVLSCGIPLAVAEVGERAERWVYAAIRGLRERP